MDACSYPKARPEATRGAAFWPGSCAIINEPGALRFRSGRTQLRSRESAGPELRVQIRFRAQEDVVVQSLTQLDDNAAQIVQNEKRSSFSNEQYQMMFSCRADSDFTKEQRRARPARSQQQMALRYSISHSFRRRGKSASHSHSGLRIDSLARYQN